ncbi:hypothetical protein [Halobacillus litoralis]|uniref:hypothetical protein n=1 Tax=Halobacillus litoralis TaxID=45668 RepID=UPI00136FDC2A|nr:hypothetical protein [Halobacillus litoralis]MYL39806.1 hypothetical protein [Halobacillus litoralis]
MSNDYLTEEEMWKEIQRLREVEKKQSELLKKMTGKGLYETRIKPNEDGVVIVDPDDPDQKKLWDLD